LRVYGWLIIDDGVLLMILGAHVSISKGLLGAVQAAVSIGANTFQFFTRNPRGGNAKKLDLADIHAAQALMAEQNFGQLVAHAPYTYNLASAKPEVREFSLRTLREDLLRVEAMGVPFVVLHAGTHGGQGVERGIQLVIDGLNSLISVIPEGVTILLEGMAGEGTELGYTIAQLGQIISGCGNHPGLGICLDTCHLNGAGYDLTDLVALKKEITEEIGLERLKVLHLNDTIFPLGSKRDRHAKLGEGYLGLETIRKIVCDEDFRKVVLILETPNELEGYAQEIKLVQEMCS